MGDPPSFPLLSPSLLALLTFPSGLFLPREPTSSLSLIPRPTLHYYYQRAQEALQSSLPHRGVRGEPPAVPPPLLHHSPSRLDIPRPARYDTYLLRYYYNTSSCEKSKQHRYRHHHPRLFIEARRTPSLSVGVGVLLLPHPWNGAHAILCACVTQLYRCCEELL